MRETTRVIPKKIDYKETPITTSSSQYQNYRSFIPY